LVAGPVQFAHQFKGDNQRIDGDGEGNNKKDDKKRAEEEVVQSELDGGEGEGEVEEAEKENKIVNIEYDEVSEKEEIERSKEGAPKGREVKLQHFAQVGLFGFLGHREPRNKAPVSEHA